MHSTSYWGGDPRPNIALTFGMEELDYGECLTRWKVRSPVSIQYTNVTDGQTEWQTNTVDSIDHAMLSIAQQKLRQTESRPTFQESASIWCHPHDLVSPSLPGMKRIHQSIFFTSRHAPPPCHAISLASHSTALRFLSGFYPILTITWKFWIICNLFPINYSTILIM